MQSPNQQRQPNSHRRNFTVSPVAIACGLLLLSSGGVHAQDTAATNTLETKVISGIRKSLEDSVALKRGSDSIIEAVSAEDLGKLPDASIAEALSRLPGVTGQRGPDGRVNVISIRGLSPEFSGSLLNGREVVSSSDSRAVEYDQFPSELIGSAVVYKTPDGTLIGQGLSGTVDLRSRRPLDSRGREVAVNLRGETNSNGNLVPGVANPLGTRFSVSYVDQFANNTVGVALGFARLNSATQVKRTELDEMDDTLDAVKDGKIVGTIVQSPFEFGNQSMRILAALAKGDDSVLKKYPGIDADNRIFIEHRKTIFTNFNRPARPVAGEP